MSDGASPKTRRGIQRKSRSAAKATKATAKEADLRDVLRDPMVRFALVCAVVAAVGAPLFALSDMMH